ncbi:MAG: porin [Pseudolabrys sp.]
MYTEGALRYIFQNPNNNWWLINSAGYGITADGVYGGSVANGTATSVNLTTAWGVNAGYEHFWLPQWRTPLYGGYTNVKYNGQANAILCSLQGSGTGVGNLAVANVGCDNNWQSWRIGTRTQWNVTKDFYMGLDVAYLKIDSMSTSSGLIAGVGAIPATTNQFVRGVNDQDIWMARFRVHRDFYP